MKHFVVMGVAGCGKSTVAALLAERVEGTFIEADELHGAANIDKMQSGVPLTDEDRWPWLARVADAMFVARAPVIVSCSALRYRYRSFLLENSGVPVGFIHLHTTRDIIAERMSNREGHFMPLSLLDSQFQTLEQLQADESGVVVDIAQSIEQVTDDAVQYVKSQSSDS